MKKRLLRFLPHLLALASLLWLVSDLSAINPIQSIVQRSGRAAVTFLLFTLACTPLNTLFGWRNLLPLRRPLGLYTFGWAFIHVFTFLVVDYGLFWEEILRQIAEKSYILLGVLAFLILLPLAITSFRWWMKKLGKNWKRLHRLVYLAALLAVFHFGMARKGDFFRLQGDVLQPALYLLILLILLGLRLPWRKWLRNVRLRRSAA